MKGWINLILFLTTLIGVVVYFAFFSQSEKTAFFYNQQVFEKFEGKIYLETKLEKQRISNKLFIDSLSTLINSGRHDLRELYEEKMQSFSMSESQLSEQYTRDIWKFINDGVNDYGKEKGYDFIYGATGDGSLMYANPDRDITNDIILFINEKYSGKRE